MGVRYPNLTSTQRMQVAKIAGGAERLAFGDLRHLPLEQKLAELHAISTDPAVLGHQLGDSLANVEEVGSHFQACVDLLRAAGADEAAAADKLSWRRWKRQQRWENAEGMPIL